MRRADHNRGIASHRVRSLLVSTLNAAALLLASAVSGAAIALHLAAAPPIGEHRPLRGGAATPAPVAAAVSIEEPKIVIAEPASTAQASAEAAPAIASDASATKLAAWMPTRAAPPDAERQLTFAWGYAQRHPEALAHAAEPHVSPTLAGGRTQGAETISKREPQRPPERQRAAVHRETVGAAPSGSFTDLDRDARQTPSHTERRNAKGARAFRRAQILPSARHRSLSSSPHA